MSETNDLIIDLIVKSDKYTDKEKVELLKDRLKHVRENAKSLEEKISLCISDLSGFNKLPDCIQDLLFALEQSTRSQFLLVLYASVMSMPSKFSGEYYNLDEVEGLTSKYKKLNDEFNKIFRFEERDGVTE